MYNINFIAELYDDEVMTDWYVLQHPDVEHFALLGIEIENGVTVCVWGKYSDAIQFDSHTDITNFRNKHFKQFTPIIIKTGTTT